MTLATLQASSRMTREPVTVGPDDSLGHALMMLERYPFRHLPVVEGRRLVGILSDRDLLHATAGGGGAPPAGSRWTAKDLMRRDVVTIDPAASLLEAARLLLQRRIGALPIVESGELLGILTETDLLNACHDEIFARGDLEPRVADVMCDTILALHPADPLDDAADLLSGAEARHAPILEENELVGLLSDRDVRRGLARAALDDAAAERSGRLRVPRPSVGEVMTRRVMTVEPQEWLSRAIHALTSCKLGALPVIDAGRLVGMLSVTRILQQMVSREESST